MPGVRALANTGQDDRKESLTHRRQRNSTEENCGEYAEEKVRSGKDERSQRETHGDKKPSWRKLEIWSKEE
ncbi:unnamed protein product [Allacma fusca]|uniref:Uncharacterized protein n=1 Tax=Allacma fusca TaxID=39272 RepID=A0A8J2P7H2_9HEXA|nr:unnamed protein product [Allacma fusca]